MVGLYYIYIKNCNKNKKILPHCISVCDKWQLKHPLLVIRRTDQRDRNEWRVICKRKGCSQWVKSRIAQDICNEILSHKAKEQEKQKGLQRIWILMTCSARSGSSVNITMQDPQSASKGALWISVYAPHCPFLQKKEKEFHKSCAKKKKNSKKPKQS